mmetsp:Transcript_91610/g.182068  ORF Transcript_91610/g.182068 Transcript_91610/m.182068 type:complete len:451 (-) Transcript_91610:256-1608(-)
MAQHLQEHAEEEERAAVRIQRCFRGNRKPAQKRLCHGILMVQTSDMAPVKCLVTLYEDRIDFCGTGCNCSMRTRDIRDVGITRQGFVLDVLDAGKYVLLVQSGASVDLWEKALHISCGDGDEDSDGNGPQSSDKDIRVDDASVRRVRRGRGSSATSHPIGNAPRASLASPRDHRTSATPAARSVPLVTPRDRESPCCRVGIGNQGMAVAPKERQKKTDSADFFGKITSAGGVVGGCRVNTLQLVKTFQSSPDLASFLGLLPLAHQSSSSPTLMEKILENVRVGGSEDISWEEFVAYFRNSAPPSRGMNSRRPQPVVTNASTRDLQPPPSPPQAKTTMQQVSDLTVQAWLASLREQPAHHGFLGLDEGGRVVKRYCVLFKGSLDSWEQPLTAASGQKPRHRIKLCNLCCIAKVRNGIILRCRGRSVKLHTQDVDAWHGALQSRHCSCHSAC